jgi:hypothetical protein
MSKIVSVVSAAIGLALVKRYADTIVDDKDPKPLIPAAPPEPEQKFVNIIDVRPEIRPEGITPFITVKQRAEQAAFIARQQKLTREQLLGRFGL